MNNSLVLRIGVALAIFSGLSFSLRDGIALSEQAKRDLLGPGQISIEHATIILCPAEEVMLAGNGQESVSVKKWSPASDRVTPRRFESQLGISQFGIARGLAPPAQESV